MMGDICGELDEARGSILEKAGPDTRFETRRNALEVLWKISKSIMLCDEPQIKRELMKDGMALGEFAESMAELARGMTGAERVWYKEERFYEKLVDLQNERDMETDMEGLNEVYEIFDGVRDEDDHYEDGDKDEDEVSVSDEVEELDPRAHPFDPARAPSYDPPVL